MSSVILSNPDVSFHIAVVVNNALELMKVTLGFVCNLKHFFLNASGASICTYIVSLTCTRLNNIKLQLVLTYMLVLCKNCLSKSFFCLNFSKKHPKLFYLKVIFPQLFHPKVFDFNVFSYLRNLCNEVQNLQPN